MIKKIGIGAVLVFMTACGGGTTAERPGSPAVYESIAAETNCASLQETFDRNMTRYEQRDPLARQQEGNPGKWEFAYARAADERMSCAARGWSPRS